ncbi:MAG: protein-L-isoaspartate(D-aspartate) O-methyltransferase [Calditrichia bacterium]
MMDRTPDNTDRVAERARMVEEQIVRRGVKDPRVLSAMRKVPRHLFVPPSHRSYAYADEPLPIGQGQTISQPYIVAFMTEQLRLTGDERVLEIGTGSGYQTAVLAELCDSVFTIEIIAQLGENARKTLDNLGYRNIVYRIGDGYAGWEEKAPFDAIMVTAAPPEIPQPLVRQLAEGGRMIIPVGTISQELILLEKKNGQIKKTSVLPVRFVPMKGKAETDG